MTRAGVLTKYSLGYVLPGKAGFSQGAGKIPQMVSRRGRRWEKRGVSVGVDGKRIEGAREKKIGALGSPDRNNLSVQSSYVRVHHQIETQVKRCRHWTMYLGSMKLRTLLDLLEWPRTWTPEKSNAQTLMRMNEGRRWPCAL